MSLKERLYQFRSFWIFPLLSLVLIGISFRLDHTPPRDFLWLFPIGVLIWTLIEYGLHRFVFHVRIPLRDPRLREFVNSSHLLHHASPRDRNKVLVRPSFGLIVSAILFSATFA